MMFRRLQKQLHDTELGTGSGTTGTRTCTYVQVQWGYTAANRQPHSIFSKTCLCGRKDHWTWTGGKGKGCDDYSL
jgi:hypothetical protein